ncbi:hypothetical protein LCI18_013724 [Fusarium solani-melongenae]|uniref:Uncharacterized protein n=1 Tax=Fusarium solani subsp. cucurbitae TaxID=2747967 RepID=A0ACD3ZN61_FUSSC|nr:hypothetical protein LCI18_013724 [Fusarium solani-melongenae]
MSSLNLGVYTDIRLDGFVPFVLSFVCVLSSWALEGTRLVDLAAFVLSFVFDKAFYSTFVPELFQDDSLLERCHLNFPPRGGFGRLVLKTFKTTVKWVEQRCIDFDFLLPMPDGLIRRPGLEFESDKAAGEWFNDVVDKSKLKVSQKEMLAGFANLSLGDCSEISVST